MSRSSLGVVACVAGLALVARAQFFNFNIGGSMPPPTEVKGQVRLEPAHAVVGIPCSFVFTFEGTEKVRPTGVTGLPDSGVAYLAETLEPYADNTYRLPVRFLAPCTNTLHLKVEGTQTVERRSGNVFRSASSSFRKELPPLKLEVRPCPTRRRASSDRRVRPRSGAYGDCSRKAKRAANSSRTPCAARAPASRCATSASRRLPSGRRP